MLLAESSWPEVEDYLTRSRAVIIPLGSTEQHGPLGLIGTDAMCAERVAVGMGERCGALVTPTVVYTPAAFNLDFPGTVSVTVETFKSLMSDIVASLLRHGFYQLYFLNGHGANIAPVKELVSACGPRYPVSGDQLVGLSARQRVAQTVVRGLGRDACNPFRGCADPCPLPHDR